MGQFFARLLFPLPHHRAVMIGLDAAGKTTILYKLKLGEVVNTMPTIGFNVETISFKNLSMTVWDVGGQDRIRPLWRHYYQNTSAMIFVVDSNDRERLSEARDELHKALLEEALQRVPILVFANKADLPESMHPSDIATGLGLSSLNDRHFHVQQSCATSGDGLYEGLTWLAREIRGNHY